MHLEACSLLGRPAQIEVANRSSVTLLWYSGSDGRDIAMLVGKTRLPSKGNGKSLTSATLGTTVDDIGWIPQESTWAYKPLQFTLPKKLNPLCHTTSHTLSGLQLCRKWALCSPAMDSCWKTVLCWIWMVPSWPRGKATQPVWGDHRVWPGWRIKKPQLWASTARMYPW